MLGERMVSGMTDAAQDDEATPSPLLGIEEVLADDPDGRGRAAFRRQIEEARVTVRRRLDAGVAPEEYRRLNHVLDACDAAVAVLDRHP